MGDDSSDTDTDAQEPSLYNPPAGGGEEVDREATEDHEVLHLEISRELAGQLLEVATHLGLTPSLVASRAIDLVCDEIGTVADESLSTDTLIQQYQARLDLMHILEESGQEGAEEPTWDEVDEIIQAAERDDE